MNNKKIILQPRKKLKLNNYHIEVKTLKFIAEISCLTSRLSKTITFSNIVVNILNSLFVNFHLILIC